MILFFQGKEVGQTDVCLKKYIFIIRHDVDNFGDWDWELGGGVLS